MADPFTPDPAFDAGSVAVCDWGLCAVRLQDDTRFPWLILIPRRADLRELEDLTSADRALLMDEIIRAGAAVRTLGENRGRPVDKLNVGALGTVTRQLHVHVVGRRLDDSLWPGPVWGQGSPLPYGAEALQAAASQVRRQTAG